MPQTAAPAAPAPDGVHLDVVVRDGRGRNIRDLEPADFSVVEDGASARVSSVRFGDGTREPVRVTLVFDRMRGEAARISRDAALALVSAASAQVSFSVWVIDRSPIPLRPFTIDHKSVKSAIETTTGKEALTAIRPPDDASGEVVQSTLRAADRLTREAGYPLQMAVLIGAIRGQSALPGRKALVYFSQGMPIAAADESLLNTISAATQAKVAVYTVDASGLAVTKAEEAARDLIATSRVYLDRQGRPLGPGGYDTASKLYASDGSGAITTGKNSLGNWKPPVSALASLAQRTGGFDVGGGGDYKSSMRRLMEDLTSWYEVTYARPNDVLDARYHKIHVAVNRGKAVQAPEGFYAVPDLPGGPPLSYELPLFDLLRRAPLRDLPVTVTVHQFRGNEAGRPLVALLLEARGENLQFDEDAAAGLFRAHLSVLGVVRDRTGAVVERFSRDVPLECPPQMLTSMRKRSFLFDHDLHLPPGGYSLETAIQDRLAGRNHALRTEFTVVPTSQSLSLTSLSVVGQLLAAPPGAKSDGGFHLDGKTILPALDGVVPGGKGAVATFFFRLYAPPGTGGVGLEFSFLKDGHGIVHKSLKAALQEQDPSAQVISFNISALPPGAYDVRVVANDGASRASAETRVVIQAGAAESDLADVSEEADVNVHSAAALPTAPPSAEQLNFLEQARAAALHYSAHLPNFICTQVTRRLFDKGGKGDWQNLDESSQLVSFYDGEEHYDPLTIRSRSADSERFPPYLNSSGEFGSLLRLIFSADSAARFAFVRSDNVRGRAVQVFSYAVDQPHSKYRFTYRVQGDIHTATPGYRGQVFIDPGTASVLRVILESDLLPAGFPLRRLSVSLEYGDTEVGGQVYNLPLSFTMDVAVQKRTLVRNEVDFRSYQRFTTSSRLVSEASK
jgi:VWFA-related protein